MYIDLPFHSHSIKSAPAKTRTALQPGSALTARIVLPRHEGDEDELTIDVVTSDAHLSDANLLINRMYRRRGYGSHHELSARLGQTTFVVSAGESIVGTLTLTVDSEVGLATDATFNAELNTYRREADARICELTRFAFDADRPSKRLLAALFHVILIYGQHRYGCTDLFIEVARRHRRFYETMLGFERVCGLKINESVGVPSQLMRLKVADVQNNVDEYRGASSEVNCRSLYPLFFSKEEESRICVELGPFITSGTLGREVSLRYHELNRAEMAPIATVVDPRVLGSRLISGLSRLSGRPKASHLVNKGRALKIRLPEFCRRVTPHSEGAARASFGPRLPKQDQVGGEGGTLIG